MQNQKNEIDALRRRNEVCAGFAREHVVGVAVIDIIHQLLRGSQRYIEEKTTSTCENTISNEKNARVGVARNALFNHQTNTSSC